MEAFWFDFGVFFREENHSKIKIIAGRQAGKQLSRQELEILRKIKKIGRKRERKLKIRKEKEKLGRGKVRISGMRVGRLRSLAGGGSRLSVPPLRSGLL